MRLDSRPRLRLLAGPCLLAVALTACSSSTAKPPAGAGGPTTPAPAAATTTAPGTVGTPTARATGTTSATASASAGGTSSPRPTTAASKGTTGTRTTTLGIAPGSYTYDTSGTVTVFGGTQDASGTAALTVGALSGGTQHTSLKGSHSTTDEDLVPRSNGLYLSDLHISAPQAFDVEFAISPAAVLFPAPARVGASWSWKATSTDGKTTATQSSKVVRTETLTIGGQQVSTVVVQTHLVLSGGTDYTVDVTNWVSPTYRLVVKDHTVGQGKASGISYKNDLTDVLRSVRPA